MAAVLLAVAVLLPPAAADDGLSEQGRALFNGEGAGAAGMAAAVAGRAADAARLPCASCHGRDGLGRVEGGVRAPAIVRGAGGLDRAGRTPDGGIRPAYDRAAFAAALTDGIATDGRILSERMPRYYATADDMDALWAWLAAVSGEQRQGVEDERLVLSVAGMPGMEAQADRIAASLGARIAELPARFGRRIALRREVWRPGSDGCPGAGALALVVAALDDDRSLLDAARRCAVPVLVPFHDLAGNEDALDVRGLSAPLVLQWRALRLSAGPQAVVVVPDRMSAWEEAALRFAGIRAVRPQEPPASDAGDRPVLFLPFGLDRSHPPERPAIVAAPLSGSIASYPAWLRAGHELRLAHAAPAAGMAPPPDAIYRLVADLIDQTSLAAGPAPTRAAFIAAFDRAVVRLGAGTVLDYRGYRLTGTRAVEILKARE